MSLRSINDSRGRFDLIDGWIRGNQRRSNAVALLLRLTSTVGFGAFGTVFMLLAIRERRLNQRPQVTGDAGH